MLVSIKKNKKDVSYVSTRFSSFATSLAQGKDDIGGRLIIHPHKETFRLSLLKYARD